MNKNTGGLVGLPFDSLGNRVHGRSTFQFLQQEVAGHHGARADELAVGGDQVKRVGRRDDLVQLAGRKGRRRHHDGNRSERIPPTLHKKR